MNEIDKLMSSICNCEFNRSVHEKCNNYTYCGTHDFCLYCELTKYGRAEYERGRKYEKELAKQTYGSIISFESIKKDNQ